VAVNTIFTEKSGQHLKADYFETDGGAGVRFFINGEFIQEEIYEGKNIHWAQSAAENWLAGVKTLNG